MAIKNNKREKNGWELPVHFFPGVIPKQQFPFKNGLSRFGRTFRIFNWSFMFFHAYLVKTFHFSIFGRSR